jgi:hypothetical protein
MSFSPNRSSPCRREAASSFQNLERNDLAEGSSIEETLQRQTISGNHTVGKRTGVTLPPRGAIPVNNAGFEDVDAFWDAAYSPNPDSGEKPSSRGSLEEEEEYNEHHDLNKLARKNPPELLTQPEEYERLNGIATPKNTGWSNRLLHKAMGIPTEDSPTNTVLSKVSTAPPSAKSLATLDSVAAKHQARAKETEVPLDGVAKRGDASLYRKGADPPEEILEDRKGGLDPEEKPTGPNEGFDAYDHISTAASGADDTSRRSFASPKSSGKNHDMENRMEEMLERYDDEYNNDEEEAPGFELAAQEDDGFENDRDDLEDDEDKVSVASLSWFVG